MIQAEITQLFEAHKNRLALTIADRASVNYSQLEESSRATLNYLLALGLKKGDRVCLFAKNHRLWFDFFFACLYSGIEFAPANWRLPQSEISPLLQDLNPALVISSAEFSQIPKQALPNSQHLTINDFTAGRQQSEHLSWPTLPQPKPNDCVMLLKTGGTTGRAKWARQRLEQIWLNGIHTARVCEFDSDATAIQATPLFHAGANALSTPLLLNGRHVVLMQDFTPAEYLDLVNKHRASYVFGVPTVYQMLLQEDGFTADMLPSVKWLLSGGAPCPRDLASQLGERGFTVKQGFGMTEAGVNCFQFATVATPDYIAESSNCVGTPMPHTEMSIRNGELVISGQAIFGGYLSDYEAQSARPNEVTTGDLFSVDENNRYYVQGREKEMYISGGENVYPLEVENHLADHPLLETVAIVSVPSDKWGETGLAACVVSETTSEKELLTDLASFLEPRLAGYKHPKHILIVDSLPLTPAGKIDKKAIQNLWN